MITSDVVLETKVLVSRRLEDKNTSLGLGLGLEMKVLVLILVLTKKSWAFSSLFRPWWWLKITTLLFKCVSSFTRVAQLLIKWQILVTRKLCYRKDDRAMRDLFDLELNYLFRHGVLFVRPHRARMSDQLLCDMMLSKCNWTYWSLQRQWTQRTDR